MPSPFQDCMKVLEDTARKMWENGVVGKNLVQAEYLWPMAEALTKYECAITGRVCKPPPTNIRPLTDAERAELRKGRD